jgi:hypothetical protein
LSDRRLTGAGLGLTWEVIIIRQFRRQLSAESQP